MELSSMAESRHVPSAGPTTKTPPQSVEGYVNSALRQGFTEDQIKGALRGRGWKEGAIRRLFG